jgi:2-hydroxychromene-2-carboxylate isomerase
MNQIPTVFFSFRSPFSWIAIQRLLHAVPNAHEVMEFIPYWEPDQSTAEQLNQQGATLHYVQMSKAKHLYILHDIRRLAERFGMKIVWPVDVSPWWELPHLGFLKACEMGAGAAFYRAVTEARWRHGENICDAQVIRRVAASIGLDGNLLATAPDNTKIRTLRVNGLARAYQEDIFGVPYFLYGRQRFWGFDRVDDFLAVFQKRQSADCDPLADVPVTVVSAIGAYDTDTAGGCG